MAIHLEMVSILAIFTGKHTDFCFVPQQVLSKVVVSGLSTRHVFKYLELIGNG